MSLLKPELCALEICTGISWGILFSTRPVRIGISRPSPESDSALLTDARHRASKKGHQHLRPSLSCLVLAHRPDLPAPSILQWSLPFGDRTEPVPSRKNEVAGFFLGLAVSGCPLEGQGETQRSRRFGQTAYNSGRLREYSAPRVSPPPRTDFLAKETRYWLQHNRLRKTNKPVNHPFALSGITEKAIRGNPVLSTSAEPGAILRGQSRYAVILRRASHCAPTTYFRHFSLPAGGPQRAS